MMLMMVFVDVDDDIDDYCDYDNMMMNMKDEWWLMSHELVVTMVLLMMMTKQKYYENRAHKLKITATFI